MLLTVIITFAGAQTARAGFDVKFNITGSGTVEVNGETVTSGQTIDCSIPSSSDLTITPETGYVVSSFTYDATDGLIINLIQKDDFQWSLNIDWYEGSGTPTISVHIVFAKGLAGGADEASAVALTSDDDLSRLTGGWYKVESDLTIGHTVNLRDDTHITIATGATLTVSTSDKYGISGSSGSALTVSGEGALNVSASESAISVNNYTQTGCAVTLSAPSFGLNATNDVSISGGSLTTSGADYGIFTDNGAITISGGTVSSSGEQCGMYATKAMNITGGTVSASGDYYGIRGKSVSITGGQVTASSGGIRSIYGDITLGWTSATDYITASGFTVEDGYHVKIADGQTLYDESGNAYTGNGVTIPANAILRNWGPDDFSVSGNEYTIHTTAGWGVFCDLLAADDGKAFFSGKTVRLGDDISVTQSAGSEGHEFMGTFDGDGKTLTVNITDTENQGTAPFRFISNATIRNLHVTGSVTGTAHAAGLVGKACAGTILIENCLVEANVNSTVGDTNGNKHCGGIVGHGFGGSSPVSLTLRNCVYAGTITCDQNYIGGLQGWSDGNTLTLENCLFAGNYAGKDGNTALFHPIALHNTGKATNLTATNVFATVAATVTNANFIAADGTKTTGRTSAPANLGTQGATYNYMNTTVYQHGLLYNGLYYVAPTLSTDSDNAYLINNEDDWTNFCDALYDNGTWNRFSGKTVKLGANIGTAQNPVTRMAGTSNHDFCGTFDGQGHTLTFTSNENIDGVAPFSYVSETTPTGGTEVSHPVIRNLNVVADINTSAQYASALVGRMWCTLTIEGCTVGGTIQTSDKYAAGFIAQQNGDASITDCRSSVTIQSSVEGDGIHGGFVALPGGTLNITGCVFDGKLLTTGTTTSCGGFVGYGDCNITSSLYAPAAIAQDEAEAGTDESATFARGTASGITIANCYYTRELNDGTNNTAQGKALCTANAAPAGEATHALYTVSGITPYANGITRTVGDATTFYYGGGDIVSAPYIDADGQPASHAATALSPAHMPATLTANYDSDSDQTADQAWYYVADDIEYTQTVTLAADATLILADGKTMSVETSRSSCIVSELDNKNPLYALTIYGQSTEADQCGTLSAYSSSSHQAVYVTDYAQHGGNVTANGHDYTICGDVTMTGGTLTATGIYAIYCNGDVNISGGTLTANGEKSGIYGGVTMTGGTLTAKGTNADSYGIYGSVTMTGGTLTARCTKANSYVIFGNVRFSGGNFYAWARSKGINGSVTLSWTSATDRFYATSFGGTVGIANGKHFHNGSEVLDPGTVTDMTKLDGKTLRPFKAITLADNADNSSVISEWNGGMANVTLQGRKLWKDGAWNTLVLPFAIADIQADGCPLNGATVRQLKEAYVTGTTLTLNFDAPTTAIAAGTPYIVKWDGGTAGQYTQDPVFQGVTVTTDTHDYDTQPLTTPGSDTYDPDFNTAERVRFIGTYDPKTIDTEDRSILFLGAANTLYYPSGTKTTTIGAFRAYFKIGPDDAPAANARQLTAFNLTFSDGSEQTGIREIVTDPTPRSAEGRLQGKNPSPAWEGSAAWYTLDGRKVDGQPTKKGLYIVNGRKVVIK